MASGYVFILESLIAGQSKDVQSLPRREDSLDCLDGSPIFTSLDLQSGYWQVELTEASRPLTALTVGS